MVNKKLIAGRLNWSISSQKANTSRRDEEHEWKLLLDRIWLFWKVREKCIDVSCSTSISFWCIDISMQRGRPVYTCINKFHGLPWLPTRLPWLPIFGNTKFSSAEVLNHFSSKIYKISILIIIVVEHWIIISATEPQLFECLFFY